jgi:hypothetical protein
MYKAYKGWATKTSPCTMTFEDLLCFKTILQGTGYKNEVDGNDHEK